MTEFAIDRVLHEVDGTLSRTRLRIDVRMYFDLYGHLYSSLRAMLGRVLKRKHEDICSTDWMAGQQARTMACSESLFINV